MVKKCFSAIILNQIPRKQKGQHEFQAIRKGHSRIYSIENIDVNANISKSETNRGCRPDICYKDHIFLNVYGHNITHIKIY